MKRPLAAGGGYCSGVVSKDEDRGGGGDAVSPDGGIGDTERVTG